MLRIPDTIAGEDITFHYPESKKDLTEIKEFVTAHSILALDTESTGINCYRIGWQMRTFQCGHDVDSYVVPARFRRLIGWIMAQDVAWLGHNGPHDIRSIDEHLGYETGVVCAGETYIPSHHKDSRNKQEGGTGHGLKDLAESLVDPDAGRWERELKAAFKEIMVPLPGEIYKSGPRKGTPKFRKAKISEGYGLIHSRHPAYIAYAASDTVLTYRVFLKQQGDLERFYDLYQFDKAVQSACDSLQRRAIRLDVPYTRRLSAAYTRRADRARAVALRFGCENVQSGQQIAEVLLDLGTKLREKTEKGAWKTDAAVLRGLMKDPATGSHRTDRWVTEFIHAVLLAKQLEKRREAYTEAMLREMDSRGRVHPSINSLAARTTRMSVSGPALQQLPTKDNEDELLWSEEENNAAIS